MSKTKHLAHAAVRLEKGNAKGPRKYYFHVVNQSGHIRDTSRHFLTYYFAKKNAKAEAKRLHLRFVDNT